MKKQTVTIGISALNEEKNIGVLIKSLLKQSTKYYTLKKILIISDGSTDGTVNEVRRINKKIVHVIAEPSRKGNYKRQNQIFSISTSNIVVLLDADIIVKDKHLIDKLVYPVIFKDIDLTSTGVIELAPVTFIEKVLAASMQFKRLVFNTYNNGNNIYTCHGRVRAFSMRLYKKLVFPNKVGEDAYSYLFATYKGYKYKYVTNSAIYFRLPQKLSDHTKQSIRYYGSKKAFINSFTPEFINDTYSIPHSEFIKAFIKVLIVNPYIIFYPFIVLIMKIESLFINVDTKWEVSESSKNLTGVSV